MTEQKQPQAGEWWQKGLRRLCIIGTKKNGLTVGETEFGTLIPFMWIHEWQHLPDCDSFDWRPEVWPQYWTALFAASDVAYVVREDDATWYCVMKTGTNSRKLMSCKWSSEGRKKITREQAEALLPPQESPNDWVEITDPEHVRRECDCVAGKTDDPDEWTPCVATVGHSQAAYPESKIRCRRKDLPVVKSPKRVTVRLWCETTVSNGDCNGVFAHQDEQPSCLEIKHDANGFYVEVQS